MTPWEFSTAIAGWAKGHGAETTPARSYPTDEEFEDAIARTGT